MPARTLDEHRAIEKARALLEACFKDDEFLWTGDELVELMEDVYVELGGKVPGRIAA
jgi:hypothetical protein